MDVYIADVHFKLSVKCNLFVELFREVCNLESTVAAI